MTLILSDTLAPPRMAAKGRSGDFEQLREHLELALHQQPGVGRQELGHADRRGMRSVRRPECVVDVDVGIRGEGRRERRIVGLLFRVEAQVLEHQHIARPHPLDGVLGPQAERVAGDRDVAPHQLGQPLTDRAQAKAVLDLAVGPPEVAGQDDRTRRPGAGR